MHAREFVAIPAGSWYAKAYSYIHVLNHVHLCSTYTREIELQISLIFDEFVENVLLLC